MAEATHEQQQQQQERPGNGRQAGERRPNGRPDRPEGPGDLKTRGWFGVLKRTVTEFKDDNLTDWAAALTYYTVLSLFPAIIALVSILGLVGQNPQTTNALLDIIDKVGPSSAVDTFKGPIESLITNKSGAGIALVIGLAVALWSASSYVGAFMRASNAIYEREEGRPFWKLRPTQLAVTLVMILLLALVGIAVVLTGPLASAVAGPIGLGGTAVTVWNFAKWPVLLVTVMLALAILYYWTPNVRQPKFRWITPGSALALTVWIVASALFALYVANFGSYNKTYGSLAGVVIGLIWLWISNIAVLLGQELNAELERERELQSGDHRAHEEIQLEPRSAPD
jgi:membrane protein